MRARKKPWTEKEMKINEHIIDDPTIYKGRWAKECFGNNNPIRVELGCGKGKFVNESAEKNPDINYIGIEREIHVIVTGMRTARETGGVDNLAFCKYDVSDLDKIIGEQELDRIYINFCDPWHRKRKWAKRRLTHRNFLNVYKTLLREKGEIHFKTDNKILFEFSLNEFSEMNWKMKNISLDLHKSDFKDNITTEYEEKFIALGNPIYRLEAIRP